MILGKTFFFLLATVCVFAQYQLKLDRKLSPPHSIPANPLDMYYTVPMNQTISKVVIAYVIHRNGTVVTDGSISRATFTIQSIDQYTSFNSKFHDAWARSGGQLCQKAVWWEDYPTRMDRSRAKIRCGQAPNNTLLTVQAFKGRIIVDWLYHKHNIIPNNPRIFRISYKKLDMSVDSNAFLISEPANDIVVTVQPPVSVTANHDFSLVAEIRDKNGQRLQTGLDSVAFVELTVPYYYKTFYRTENKEMLLKSSSIRLAGANVISHQSTNDFISRKRAAAGRVVFDKIRVLDAVSDLKLNLTLLMSRDPWSRIPNCDICYADTEQYNLNADGTEISFRPSLSYRYIKPMTFTDVFRVTEQQLTDLKFSDFTIESWKRWENIFTKKVYVSRNVAIPGEMFLQAVDRSGEIIYSGRDASFSLKYETIPKNVCISRDATDYFSGGKTYIYFSICEIIDDVQIVIYPAHNPNISVTTVHFNVGGFINIAHFGDFDYSGDGAEIESHVNSFVKFAAYDVNEGIVAKPLSTFGIKLRVKSFNTQSDINVAFNHFSKITQDTQQPTEKSHIMISTTTDEIARNLNPELVKMHLPYIGIFNSADVYSDVEMYPYFNRVCWSEYAIVKSVHLALKQRMWTKVTVVRSDDAVVGDTFRQLADDMEVDIKNEVRIPDFSAKTEYLIGDLLLTDEMNEIKSYGSKIIVLFADAEQQTYILRAAYLSKIDSYHGYQWIISTKYSWNFPFLNPGVCARGPMPCTVAFKGAMLFSQTYNVSGYMTEDWIRVLGYFFSTDRYNLLSGRIKYRTPNVGAKMALGYDSVLIFARALIKIISNKNTISGTGIVKNIRSISVNGLTGEILIDEKGDRTGYIGYISQVWPETNSLYLPIGKVNIPVRQLVMWHSNDQYEIPYLLDSNPKYAKGFYVIKSGKYNTRYYNSFSGRLSLINQTIVQSPGEAWPSKAIIRKENVVPPFYCKSECGNKLLSEKDINTYDYGKCMPDGTCSCYTGYTGPKCETILCTCRYGTCITPSTCECYPGWNGTSCDNAQCSECANGKCVAPNTCRCSSIVWTGYACHIHIATILAPTLFLSILIIIFMIFFIRNLIRRIRRNTALARVDWIVEWSTVTALFSSDTTVSRTNKSYISTGKPSMESYSWKNENWYVKFFDNKTMDSKDEELCLEMVLLTKVRHRNLIIYGGACIVAPNVGLFMEHAAKGSLNDLLLNDSIELGWDFRYSFMKDICSGMKYLHEKKDFGSHGRLKSSNCLVDSHWTIRISGFGAPTIRFGKYRNESGDEEKLNELLWTAPELLRDAKSLDDVKSGTPPGDIYSFAIVVVEIITRSEPYNYELGYIAVSSMLDLILGNNYPGLKETRRAWEDIGGADMLTARPIIKKEFLPEKATVRVRFKKMLEDAWHENPFSRPTFETLAGQLNIIHPVTGELIDNLINLLESYSNNLEMIVIERTNELEANKARAEELLSQMLPPNVTSELKRGRKVLPESFECATVFFSDIVDFAAICQKSSPLQIVALLNETYNVFDEVLDEHDVYKVETISDSYMVVSGVPMENGNKHAGEICTMALDLMSTVTTFQIPHKPKATLQLRIGINSGPVVAGVVGVLMPRYCLFGDTVNTASRMMSSSHALCIQISDKTADILDDLGGYDLECRGERQVKGRGTMTTYWLWGKDDFRKRLPDQSLAIPLSQHKFK